MNRVRIYFSMIFWILGVFVFVSCNNHSSSQEGEKAQSMSKNTITGVRDVTGTILWTGTKKIGKHNGSINLESGSIVMKQGKIVGGEFTVEMNSIVCQDITDAKKNAGLVAHLKSADFFDVEKYPTAYLKILGSEGNQVSADLTIKGITKPITFPIQISEKEGVEVVKANITVDRTKYDVKYGSGKFFDNLGDRLINDDFNLLVILMVPSK